MRPTLAEAQTWCKALAASHYENFHVATFFLPKRVRPHFESVYAYCRVSDDLGDEVADRATATALLDAWGGMLDECYDASKRSRHPVFVALHETVAATGAPRELFASLLRAFRLDQVKTHYESMAELMAYSEDSANPVGRLVLWVCGYREERLAVLSDKICTALQLANFWQDVAEDDDRGRRYLPENQMRRFGATDAQIRERRFDPAFWRLMQSLVEETRAMLREGVPLVSMVDLELATTLGLFVQGGHAILDAIEARGFDVLARRPEVTKAKKARLLAGALLGKVRGGARVTEALTLDQAYAVCRAIAKREAKNFYYSFRALPGRKRDAMCAVYAFMRQADDIADDESLPVAERRVAMGDWLGRWRAFRVAGQGRRGRDAVFVALWDTQRRFDIPDSLLEELVQGTKMDLEEAGAGIDVGAGLRGYATYEELYRYCYLVASVVGLVCIRIFGYGDPRAEELAEKTGIAFQLTNILRDVKEDAERGRLYLPMDMMAEYSVTPDDVVALAGGRALRPNERGLVHAISARAWDNYAEAGRLLPLIHRDSRPALWVLVTIYSGLLARVDARNGDVFSERVRVPTAVKMGILLRGLAGAVMSWIGR